MKYIKKFEYKDDCLFKIGDKVICLDAEQSEDKLKYKYIYEIKFIKYMRENQLSLVETGSEMWYDDRFRLATDKEIKDFELTQATNKYNI